MKSSLLKRVLFLTILALLSFVSLYSQGNEKLKNKVLDKLSSWQNPLTQWRHISKLKLDSVQVNKDAEVMTLWFAPGLSYYPVREDSYNLFIQSLKKSLGRKFREYSVNVITNNFSLDKLIPNIWRKEFPVDSLRLPVINKNRPVLIRKPDTPEPVKGLYGNSVALWHSHGYYFEMNLDRWEWQRARLFGTVEDVAVMGFVVPFLTKMLENAGANVFLPRERDTQPDEVIVDNDRSTGNSEVVLHLNDNVQKINEGFLMTDTLFPGYNPFKHGTSLRIFNDSAIYIPEIPERGNYAVYVSYPARKDNSRAVEYNVLHTGGVTEFIVNQTIGGETWIYLGTFLFNSGKNVNSGSVTVKGIRNDEGYIALDAIRFGGGTGNVARKPSPELIKNQLSSNENNSIKSRIDSTGSPDFKWKLSGKPRFLEAARYYLQYAGMPDTLVYSPNIYKNDYNDDYQSRGYWVNYLIDDPYGAEKNPKHPGLGLPIDLSVAFHTDAGITPGDSIIGTLAIYSTGADSGKFPDGTSRMASRDLSDIIQTQVIDDIRTIYKPDWTRRGLWDRPYSEARRPNVPAILLELLSHQNIADQRYGLDPRFRFDVSRAIYKGILKYLSYVENRDYIVQPLPVTNFAVMPVSGKTVRLSWKPGIDKFEPSAKPDKYLVYKRTGDNGFDNGMLVYDSAAVIELDSFDTIYSFKVTALNDGGESFDSEILSAGIRAGNETGILVVNGFDRISGPVMFDNENMAGIAWWNDRGVAYKNDIITVGDQYDFNRKAPWLDDDSPGWGASYSDIAGKIIPGNNFDYPYLHGKAILSAGHSFYSVSNRYFCSDDFRPSSWKSVDLIFGEEKSTPFFNDTSKVDFRIYNPEFMKRIADLTQSGTDIFISGAYIGSDLTFNKGDSTAIKFAENTLHFLPRTDHAVKIGKVYATDYAKPAFSGIIDFNTGFSESIYQVEAPDAIEPAGRGAICSFRYSESNASAGVTFKGRYKTFILGFPFEAILSESQRNMLMRQILDFFEK